MKRLVAVVAMLLVGALPTASPAQVCPETNSVGPYTVDFIGSSFDGLDTEFEYCITTETYLHEWKLFLDPACIDPGTITDCGPSSCAYDDTGGITGILFDGLDVGPGQTACFTFSLDGDWTGQIGEVQIRLKNDRGGNKVTDICGPICRVCVADLDVRVSGGATTVSLGLVHNKPPTVESGLKLTVYNERGKRVRRWKSQRFNLAHGQAFDYEGTIPGRRLRPGKYTLLVELKGMSGWHELRAKFQVPE
jgi:hypothetical protein